MIIIISSSSTIIMTGPAGTPARSPGPRACAAFAMRGTRPIHDMAFLDLHCVILFYISFLTLVYII